MNEEMMVSDTFTMAHYIMGYRVSQIVHAAATISLADHAMQGDITPEHLAQVEHLDPDATHRFLRACTAIGLTTHQQGSFQGTPLLATLRNDPSSLRALALSLPAPAFWLPWGSFMTALRTGKDQAKATLGSTLFAYHADHPQEAEDFAATLRQETQGLTAAITRLVDTTDVTTVADIGGSSSTLAEAFLAANDRLNAILFDLPPVIARARSSYTGDNRLTFVAGDFFTAVPPADLFILKHVLHDWNDAECSRILERCRASLSERGRIIIVEMQVNDDFSGLGPLMDMTMLVAFSGRERTVAEYGVLLAAAGLTILSTSPIDQGYVVIEAAAVSA